VAAAVVDPYQDEDEDEDEEDAVTLEIDGV
jgi:hypothetical protein